ncbi:hypothetical protein BC937DRAFT_94621, partial [Endogone sp. FLAS-F59071]
SDQQHLGAYNTESSKWDRFPVTYKLSDSPGPALTTEVLVINIPNNSVTNIPNNFEMLFVINYKLGFYLYEFSYHDSSLTSINVTLLNVEPQIDPTTMRGAGIVTLDDMIYVFGGNASDVWIFNLTSVSAYNISGETLLPNAAGIAAVLPGTKIICFFSFGDGFKNVYRLDTLAQQLTYNQFPITGSFPNFNASSPMAILQGDQSDIYIYNQYADQWTKYTESPSGERSWITLPPSWNMSMQGTQSGSNSTSSIFPASASGSPSESSSGGVLTAAIAGGVGGGVGAILIVVAILFLCCRNRRKSSKPTKGVLAARGYAGVDDDHEDTKYTEYDQTYHDPIPVASTIQDNVPFATTARTNSVSSIFRVPSLSMAEILKQHRPVPTVYDNWSEPDATPISPAGTVILGRYVLTDGSAIQLNANTALRSATDASTDELLMLKFSADSVAFAREMAIVSYLASPHIVAPHTTYELRTATQYRYISVSEHSFTLDQILPTIDADDAFFFKLAVKSLAECLRACHAKRIVHLDFTPQNMVHEAGDVTTWRLINFEAAGVVGDHIDRQMEATVPRRGRGGEEKDGPKWVDRSIGGRVRGQVRRETTKGAAGHGSKEKDVGE